jgi:hypothetical protein
LTVLIGKSPRSSRLEGASLSCTAYSKAPIFSLPTGVIRFWAASALATSCPDRPLACRAVGIEVDLNLPLLAAERVGNGGAGHGDERRAHLVDADVGQPLLGEALARQRHQQDRHGGGVVIEDQRRRRAGRHRLDQGLRDRRDLGVGGADVDVGLKEDLDDAEAVVGIGLDMFDVVDGGRQRALERRRDAPGHLVRRQPRVLPDDADDRNADVGKDVGRRSQSGERADDQDQQRQHDERIGARQRDANQGDHRKGVSVIANKSPSGGANLGRPSRISSVSAITLR